MLNLIILLIQKITKICKTMMLQNKAIIKVILAQHRNSNNLLSKIHLLLKKGVLQEMKVGLNKIFLKDFIKK